MSDDKKNKGFGAGFMADMLKDLQEELKVDKNPKRKGKQGGPSKESAKKPFELKKEPLEPRNKPSKNPLEPKNKPDGRTAMPAIHIDRMTGCHRPGDYTPGDVLLDTYRVESQAIKGGMGAVWRVHHTGWDVDLAMKRPKSEAFRTDAQKQGFTDECRFWMNLGLHPNIVSCYYVREIEGVPTIFSEWMESGSLEQHIKDRTLYDGTEEEVQERLLDIAIQFARGLHYAHENELIHQDVKPDNLLLTGDWSAKVSDFGLAKARTMLTFLDGVATEPDYDSDATMVSPGGGRTPAYCSPEQAAAQLLTRRTDIYSWAVSVLEMYLGFKPWAHGRELTGPLVGSVCRDYFGMCMERPMPEELQDLLAECMEMNPDDRPRDFAVVEAELKKIYASVCGYEYSRPEPKAAAETATSLNNRALSYLDLGETEKAEDLLKQAIRKDPDDFYATYNYDLLLWRRGIVSDIDIHDDLFRIPDTCTASSVARAKISLCARKDMKEAEECLAQLETRDVSSSIKDEISRSMAGWKQCCSITDEDEFLPAAGFSAAFPQLEIVPGMPLRVIEKNSGRILKEMDIRSVYYLKLYTTEEWLEGFRPEGSALLRGEYDLKRCIELPDSELPFYFEPAVIENQQQRQSAEQQGRLDYYAAKNAYDIGHISEAAGILNKSLRRGTLTLHEPSMRLWTRLGKFYKKGKLIAVVPTDEAASPAPAAVPDPSRVCQKTGDIFNYGWMCISCDGITEIKLDCSHLDTRETMNLNTEADFVFRITAVDVATGSEYFVIDPFFSETTDDDDGPFPLYQVRLKEPWKIELWSQYQKPMVWDYSDSDKMRFALQSGYYLHNCREGVSIGDIVFEDKFTEFRPLFDAEIIPCQNHNYRLIYEYVPDSE